MKQNGTSHHPHYRKTIRNTDPRVNIQVPSSIYVDLKKMAGYNARKFSDEIVARLAATLQHWDRIIFQTQPSMLRLDRGVVYKD